jgi:predicted phosphodiesterase
VIQTLGDPHLGRTFIHDVPLHRRGDRERMVQEDFVRQLVPSGRLHVCMGDLFDKPVVPLETILFAAQHYQAAAKQHPNSVFVVIRGNHDAGRDLERVTAFDVFAQLVADIPNIYVVFDILRFEQNVFFGWQPETTADAQAAAAGLREGDTVFGHWDVDLRGDGRYRIPTEVFSEAGVVHAYTGHIHKPEQFTRDGVAVTVVGSMQPYAHGEGDSLYITLTLAELAVRDVSNMCVRVALAPGEVIETIPNCLQFKTISEAEVTLPAAPTLDTFDFNGRFEALLEAVPKDIAEQVRRKWTE